MYVLVGCQEDVLCVCLLFGGDGKGRDCRSSYRSAGSKPRQRSLSMQLGIGIVVVVPMLDVDGHMAQYPWS